MSKTILESRIQKYTEIDLMPKMFHLSSGMQPISAKDYGDKVKSEIKDENGKNLSLKEKIDQLKAKYIKFEHNELGQIKDQNLYLCLCEPARTQLYEFVSSSSPLMESLPATQLVQSNDKMAIALAYLAISNSDAPLLQNFELSLVKCKQLFRAGENIEGLKDYVQHCKDSKHDSKMIVTLALAEASISPNHPPLSSQWQALLAGDKEVLIPKLLKDVQLINDFELYQEGRIIKPSGQAPRNLGEAIEINSKRLLQSVFQRIEGMNEGDLLSKRLTRNELLQLPQDMYKLSLNSHNNDADKDISLNKALHLALDAIDQIKTKATDEMPELRVPTYNQLMEIERGRVAEMLGLKLHSASESDSDDQPQASAGATIPKASKAKTPEFNYYMSKLEAGDLRGFYLGKLTNCCQSIDGNARMAVHHGMTQPDSAFYVIREVRSGKIPDPKIDRIVAQSWAWKSEDDESIVFDSFERVGPEKEKLCKPFMKAVAEQLKAEGYKYVGLGTGGNTPKLAALAQLSSVKMRKANGYEFKNGLLYQDSKEQFDLAQLSSMPSFIELYNLGFIKNDEDVKKICKKIQDVDFKRESISALHAENIELFGILVKLGKVDVQNFFAQVNLTPKIARALVALKADVNIKNDKGSTALHRTQDIETVQILIDAGANVNATDLHDRTPLYTTYEPELARILIDRGADVNFKDRFDRTPLHLVTKPDVAQVLIDKGANIYSTSVSGHSPITLMQDNVQSERAAAVFVKMLPNEKSDNQKILDLLMEAAKQQLGREKLTSNADRKDVKYIDDSGYIIIDDDEEKGAFIEKDYPRYPSHYNLLEASYAADIEGAKYLLSKGNVDIDKKTPEGFTALHYAIYSGLPEIVKLIVDAKADTTIPYPDGGETARELAEAIKDDEQGNIAKCNQIDVIIKMLEKREQEIARSKAVSIDPIDSDLPEADASALATAVTQLHKAAASVAEDVAALKATPSVRVLDRHDTKLAGAGGRED